MVESGAYRKDVPSGASVPTFPYATFITPLAFGKSITPEIAYDTCVPFAH